MKMSTSGSSRMEITWPKLGALSESCSALAVKLGGRGSSNFLPDQSPNR